MSSLVASDNIERMIKTEFDILENNEASDVDSIEAQEILFEDEEVKLEQEFTPSPEIDADEKVSKAEMEEALAREKERFK